MEKREARGLFMAVFISGACAMVVELAGARVIAPYLGNTIYTWAAVIGLVMAALSAGYYFGGLLADRNRDRGQFSSILLFAGLLTLLVPVLGIGIVPLTTFLDIRLASIIAGLILVPASVCYGMVSPYAIKLTAASGSEGKNAGSIFAISTAGSILGTLATGFLLVPNIRLTHIFVMAAALMAVSSWLVHGKRKIAAFEGALLLAAALVVSPLGFFPMFGGKVIYEADSLYYHISVAETVMDGGPARVLYLDNAPSSAEFTDGGAAFGYVRTSQRAYGIAENPARVLVIGVAGGTEVEDAKRMFPEAMVDGVDIDAKAVDAGERFFSLEEDGRTNITIDDARRYVARNGNEYGLVIIDVFRGMSIPPHLVTREFFTRLKGRMAPDGAVVANIISSVEGERDGVFASVHSTLSSVFRNVVVMPVGDGPREMQNIIIIATDRDVGSFVATNRGDVYYGEIRKTEPLSDELNPIELFVAR